MPAMASLEDLRQAARELESLKAGYPEAYAELVRLFARNRGLGYKNICKLMMGEATAEKLKGLS
jgi:hypothetical protein